MWPPHLGNVLDSAYHLTAGAAAEPGLRGRLGRSDPPVQLHRFRLAGELCELGDDELRFCKLLLSSGVELGDQQLALLHERSEGWAAALHTAARSLAGAQDPAGVMRALAVLSRSVSEYFIAEVLDPQPPDLAHFMLDISILGRITADSCVALTGRPDGRGAATARP